MGKMLGALLHLQSIERQLAQLRRQLRTGRNAVTTQQQRIDRIRGDWDALHEKYMARRSQADRLELDLKEKEQRVSKLRMALNVTKTNKEYAAILTLINTLKADNAKLEDQALRIMQDADAVKAEADKLTEQIVFEEKRLEDIRHTGAEEETRLVAMLEEITARRVEAAGDVPPEVLGVFDRIATNYDGDAMAVIEISGQKPPHDYVCGGCFMSLNAEHANALRVRDEIRTCDNCGRILYLEPQSEESRT